MTDKPVSIEELREELKAKGYEGLYCTDERCGCGLDYLVACGEPLDGDEGILEICKPAYKHTCIGGECAYPCDGYGPSKPATRMVDWRQRAEQAEAEVERLKNRRCDECDCREGSSHYCLLWAVNTPDEHYCRDWTAREEEP